MESSFPKYPNVFLSPFKLLSLVNHHQKETRDVSKNCFHLFLKSNYGFQKSGQRQINLDDME